MENIATILINKEKHPAVITTKFLLQFLKNERIRKVQSYKIGCHYLWGNGKHRSDTITAADLSAREFPTPPSVVSTDMLIIALRLIYER